MGLVNRVIRIRLFMEEVTAYARMLATEVSPRSLREMKRDIWNVPSSGPWAGDRGGQRRPFREASSPRTSRRASPLLEKRPAAFHRPLIHGLIRGRT